jgi:zinc protease
VVVGDVTMAELQPQLERAFVGWRAPSTPLPAKPEATVATAPAQPQVFLVNRPGPQSIIMAGRLTAPFDAATEPGLDTFNSALGGTFTSRINMNLREDKHWSYGASSGVRTANGPRLFAATAAVQSDKTAESTAEVRKELAEVISQRPMTQAEIDATKANLVQGMAGEWETNGAVMNDLTQMVVYGRPENYFDTYAERVRATTPQSASLAAQSVVGTGPTTWVIVGDVATMKPKIEALNLGQVQVVDVNGNPVP